MDSRLDRYSFFIDTEYRSGLTKYAEYSLDFVTPELIEKFRNGAVDRIVFTGMGCSAIVSDIIKGYFTEIGASIEVHVVNDYEFQFLAARSVVDDDRTVFIISSYSGHSQEPLRAYNLLRHRRDNILLLTSGGPLADAGIRDGASIAYWQLQSPDREYPLFHVTQYFAILMDLFAQLGVADDDHHDRLAALAIRLADLWDGPAALLTEQIASNSVDANIVMIATPKWHESLLKLAKMHYNEMAMVPATRNFFHEFCHSEVATLSDPNRKHSILLIDDPDDDGYTRKKAANLERLLTTPRTENANITFSRLTLRGDGFLEKYFYALEVIQRSALALGRYRVVDSRNLISDAAGNPWYHSTTIDRELSATVQ